MNKTANSLAPTMKDAARLVGVDYRTNKQCIENGTIPTIQLGPDDPPGRAAAGVRDQRLSAALAFPAKSVRRQVPF